jgi:hypothetical protein
LIFVLFVRISSLFSFSCFSWTRFSPNGDTIDAEATLNAASLYVETCPFCFNDTFPITIYFCSIDFNGKVFQMNTKKEEKKTLIRISHVSQFFFSFCFAEETLTWSNQPIASANISTACSLLASSSSSGFCCSFVFVVSYLFFVIVFRLYFDYFD